MTKTTAILFRVHKAHDDLPAMYQANFCEETFDGSEYTRRKFTVKSQSLQTLFHVARKFDAEVWYHYFDGTEECIVKK